MSQPGAAQALNIPPSGLSKNIQDLLCALIGMFEVGSEWECVCDYQDNHLGGWKRRIRIVDIYFNEKDALVAQVTDRPDIYIWHPAGDPRRAIVSSDRRAYSYIFARDPAKWITLFTRTDGVIYMPKQAPSDPNVDNERQIVL